jgi:hypothetical protein
MTLPASQQHALDAIDDVFQSGEPRLATMFGVFTHLTWQESMPAVETLPPGQWWTRYRLPGRHYRPRRQHHPRGPRASRLGRLVLVPLLLVAAVSLLISSLVSAGTAGRRGCDQAVVMAARQRTTAQAAGGGGTAGLGGASCHSASPQTAGGSR